MIDDQLTPAGEHPEETRQETPEALAAVSAEDGVSPSTEAATPVPSEPEEALATPDVAVSDVSVDAADEAPTPTPEPEPEPEPVALAEPIAEEAPAAPPEAPSPQEDADLFAAEMARLEGGDDSRRDSGVRLSRGERVEATVIQVEKDKVFVDLGTKAEGVVPLSELSDTGLDSALGHVEVGDKFDVVVLRPEGSEGNPIVSKKRADFDLAWNRILDSFDEGRVFQAQVVDRVKGGLVVDIGVRGFVPATHVGTGKLRNIEKYVGETLPVKIIEIDRERRKVVLSNRLAEDERREEMKADIFTKVAPGDVLPGTVRRLTDYGAFVDLGGIDGLLHISEMSWVRIDHPREVLKEGDKINVMILRLDPSGGRISLGLRQVLPDPWNLIRENYKVGQKIQVKVSRLVQSGAFVRLPEGAEAFLPVSEISNRRLKKPNEVLEEGQDIEPTILDLRPEERRMVLSLRDATFEDRHRERSHDRDHDRGDWGYGDDRGKRKRPKKRGPHDAPSFEASAPGGRAPTGGATIGERLGMLKGILRQEDGEPATKTEPAPAEAAKPKAKPAPEEAEAVKAAPTPEETEPATPEPVAIEEPVAEEPKPTEPEPTPEAEPEKAPEAGE